MCLLAGYPASLGPLRPCLPPFLPASLSRLPLPFSLPTAPPSLLPLSILGLPGFSQSICVIAQDNCIPEILDASGYFDILTSKTPHRGGVNKNVSIFSAVHEILRTLEILTPKTFTPQWGGLNYFIDFLGSS